MVSGTRALSASAALLLALMMLSQATGISSTAAAAGEPAESVLRIGILEVVDTLNPLLGMTSASELLFSLLYDSLQSVNSHMEAVPDLAVDWWIVPESDPALATSGEPYGSVWQYNLTRMAKWHDGAPFTADDAVFTVNLYCRGDNYSYIWKEQPYSYFMSYAEKVDQYTLRIHFYDRATGEPTRASYGYLLSFPMLPTHKLSSQTPADLGFQWIGTIPDSSPPIIGTGPFMATDDVYDEWLNERITLVKTPSYHGEDTAIDRIILDHFDDPDEMAYALVAGEIDVAELPGEQYLDLKSGVVGGSLMNLTVFEGLSCSQRFVYLSFLADDSGPNPVRADPAVRRALAMATNRTLVVESFYGGLAKEGSTIVSPIMETWHYEPDEAERLDFDIAAANELLESAGYEYPNPNADVRVATASSLAVQEGWVPVNTPLELNMAVRRGFPEERLIASSLAQHWGEVGVSVQITLYEDYYRYILCPVQLDVAVWSWDALDPDPNEILFAQTTRALSGWSDSKYSSAEYDDEYNLSVSSLDAAERRVHVLNCQRIHYIAAPYVVLAYPYQTYVWRTDTFEGWSNWAEEPGMSLDASWFANPLLFNLSPLGNGGSDLLWVAVFVVIAVAVVVAVVLLYLRSR